MIRLTKIAALLAVAACGADGPPERPTQKPGLEVSGTVEVGITGGG
ncbi:argininosuccinate lyase [Aliiroseovarius sp. YM-037]